MAGLVPAIHVFGHDAKKDVDARDKRGHDGYTYVRGNKQSSDPHLEIAVTKPNSDAPILCEVDGRGVAQVVAQPPGAQQCL